MSINGWIEILFTEWETNKNKQKQKKTNKCMSHLSYYINEMFTLCTLLFFGVHLRVGVCDTQHCPDKLFSQCSFNFNDNWNAAIRNMNMSLVDAFLKLFDWIFIWIANMHNLLLFFVSFFVCGKKNVWYSLRVSCQMQKPKKKIN